MKKIVVYFDGGIHKSRTAIVDVTNDYKIMVSEDSKPHTSNEMEFHALIKALDYIFSEYGSKAKNVVVYGDSQLVINSIKHDNHYYVTNLKRLAKKSKTKISKFKIPPTVIWVSREENLAGFVLEMLYKKRVLLDRIKINHKSDFRSHGLSTIKI